MQANSFTRNLFITLFSGLFIRVLQRGKTVFVFCVERMLRPRYYDVSTNEAVPTTDDSWPLFPHTLWLAPAEYRRELRRE